MPVSPAHSSPERVGPLKSRRGCKTCKIRKIKCGEEKPSCRRCIISKFTCEYSNPTTNSYGYASASSTASILDCPVSIYPGTVWRERRAFAYYFQHAAPYLAGGFDRDFWRTVIPQICRTEPAVWDAVNAISTLFETPEMCLDFVFLSLRHEKSPALKQNQKEALGWYSRSLTKVRTEIDRGNIDVLVALVSCVLFVCIEMVQGHVEEALQLYNQGTKLILDLRAKKNAPAEVGLLEDTIVPLFIRLGTAALTISGVPVCDLFSEIDTQRIFNFTSLESARDAIVPLAAETLVLQKETGRNPFIGVELQVTPELLAKQCRLQERLTHWYHAYTHFMEKSHHKSPPPDDNTSIPALLLAYHTTLHILISTCLSHSESIYDMYLSSFTLIVEQASIALNASANPDGSQPAFTFELGVGLPLVWTAMKCRELSVRRRALELLQKAPPLQGFYKCAPGTMLATKVMQLEEMFSRHILLNAISTPGDDNLKITTIHEEARIQDYCIFLPHYQPFLLGPHDVSGWGRGSEQLFMRFSRNRRIPGKDGGWCLSDECVPMD
ncbi:hypothetical protein BJX99DRAFT_237318 [Aspergillus californicus]